MNLVFDRMISIFLQIICRFLKYIHSSVLIQVQFHAISLFEQLAPLVYSRKPPWRQMSSVLLSIIILHKIDIIRNEYVNFDISYTLIRGVYFTPLSYVMVEDSINTISCQPHFASQCLQIVIKSWLATSCRNDLSLRSYYSILWLYKKTLLRTKHV